MIYVIMYFQWSARLLIQLSKSSQTFYFLWRSVSSMRKIIMIHIFFLVISILVYVEGITKSGPDLIWNMMLALVAYDFAILTRYFRQAWLFPLLFILW